MLWSNTVQEVSSHWHTLRKSTTWSEGNDQVQSVILQLSCQQHNLNFIDYMWLLHWNADSHKGSIESAMVGVTKESNIPYNYIII